MRNWATKKTKIIGDYLKNRGTEITEVSLEVSVQKGITKNVKVPKVVLPVNQNDGVRVFWIVWTENYKKNSFNLIIKEDSKVKTLMLVKNRVRVLDNRVLSLIVFVRIEKIQICS